MSSMASKIVPVPLTQSAMISWIAAALASLGACSNFFSASFTRQI